MLTLRLAHIPTHQPVAVVLRDDTGTLLLIDPRLDDEERLASILRLLTARERERLECHDVATPCSHGDHSGLFTSGNAGPFHLATWSDVDESASA